MLRQTREEGGIKKTMPRKHPETVQKVEILGANDSDKRQKARNDGKVGYHPQHGVCSCWGSGVLRGDDGGRDGAYESPKEMEN